MADRTHHLLMNVSCDAYLRQRCFGTNVTKSWQLYGTKPPWGSVHQVLRDNASNVDLAEMMQEAAITAQFHHDNVLTHRHIAIVRTRVLCYVL